MLSVFDLFCFDMLFYVLRFLSFKIDLEMIGLVIGFGGKIIKGIIEEIGVKIDIDDDGIVIIVVVDGEKVK